MRVGSRRRSGKATRKAPNDPPAVHLYPETQAVDPRKEMGVPDHPRLNFRQVERVRVSDLQASAKNARTHSRVQIQQIAASIKKFGFTNPILADADNRVVAGHGRWLAAKELKYRYVPVIRLDNLTREELQAYAIADNRLAEKAGWDDRLLGLELKALASLDLDFDLELTGFEMGEIDQIISKLDSTGGQHEADEAADCCVAINRSAPAVAQTGDLWLLGDHVLAVGDARDSALVGRLMDCQCADAVVSDPPYNTQIAGFASGKGQTKHANFIMAAGEMSAKEFSAFLERCIGLMVAHTIDGGFLSLFMDWRHIAQLISAGETLGLRLLNICVWVKPRGGMGSLYRSQHELVAVFGTGAKVAQNNIQLGRFGRNRTNVWHYAGPNPLLSAGRADLAVHPTVKPVAMIADAILDVTTRGGCVLDPFAGSGTIFIAAEKTGRRARGIEIDPHYADACIQRWQGYTGRRAVLASGKTPFGRVAARRSTGAVSAQSGLQGRK